MSLWHGPVVMFLALALAAVLRREEDPPPRAVLVIHGGAGAISQKKMTPEKEKHYRDELERALRAGYQALERDQGTSLDAVEAAVRVMEDSPLFNAGKGAVFNHDGRNEMDAAVMDGKTRRAGAVAAVTVIKNPVSAARAVMEKSKHVLLVGRGAEVFASEQGLEVVDPSYFFTRERWMEWQRALKREKEGGKGLHAELDVLDDGHRFGTVGAVARDRHGHLAAATSTGGMTNKHSGRVGDSPVIGAGTYAEDGACAVSGTGHGEVFIRYGVAHEVASLIKYKKRSVQEAADAVLRGLPEESGGVGGLIAIDGEGNFATPFNTEGMYRGYITPDGKTHVEIYHR